MQMDLAKRILDGAANPDDKRCQWCNHPGKRIRCAGLCNHCYRLKLEMRRCELDLANIELSTDDPRASVPEKPFLERRLRVAGQMVDLAKAEGDSYGRFADTVGGITLEHQFNRISKRWLRTDLFHGWANVFDQSFDETQKRFLFLVLRTMIVEHSRQHRRRLAEAKILASELDRS